MSRVFLDASALVPLVVKRDQWAPRMHALMNGLQAGGRPVFVTSNWTLYEAMGLAHRVSPRLSQTLYSFVRGQMTTYGVRPGDEAEAVRRFLQWSDQTASIVDHANLLVAVEHRCEAVVSFDDDFRPLVEGTGLRLLR